MTDTRAPTGEDAADAPDPSPRRRRGVAVIVAALVLLATLPIYGWWVVSASSDHYDHADAVIVHAGQRHRLRHALRLMDEGVAPVLVLLFARDAYGRDAAELCGGHHDYEVLCTDPEREDTVGEAIEIGRLAEERDWQSVVVVTSGYHLRRARYLDRSCTGITVYGEGARYRSRPTTLRSAVQEMAAFPVALLQACR